MAGANQDLGAAPQAVLLIAALRQLPLYDAQRLVDMLTVQVDNWKTACLACNNAPNLDSTLPTLLG